MNNLTIKPPKMKAAKMIFITIMFILIVVLINIIFSCTVQGQDTIPCTLVIQDSTYTTEECYGVQDAYNDSVTYNSSGYYEYIPGWIVDGEYLTLRFETLEPKYKVVTFWEREWYTIESSVQEIEEPGQTTKIYSREIWFQK